MKKIAFIVFCVMLFTFGYKTHQKAATENSVKEQRDIANDITSPEISSIDEAVQRSIEKLKSGKYGINY